MLPYRGGRAIGATVSNPSNGHEGVLFSIEASRTSLRFAARAKPGKRIQIGQILGPAFLSAVKFGSSLRFSLSMTRAARSRDSSIWT